VNSLVRTAAVDFVVSPGHPVAPVAELEHALQGPVAERLDDALADQLLDPAAVICLRHVHVDVDLSTGAPFSDETVRGWARQLAAGIWRAVDRDGRAMVFPDENCYWADLLADLTGGRAPAWYQEAHARHWEKSRPEAVADVLDQSGDPGGVLLRVAERHPRALAPMLGALPDPALETAARQVLGTGDESDVAIIVAALAVADCLTLWSVARWSPTQVLAAGVRPAVADWRSTEALSVSVVALVAELVRLRVLTAPPRASSARAELAADATLSWLDAEVLATGLSALRTDLAQQAVDRPVVPMQQRAAGPPAESFRVENEASVGLERDSFSDQVPDPVAGPDRPERLAASIARIVTDKQAALPAVDAPPVPMRHREGPPAESFGGETEATAGSEQDGVSRRVPDLVAGSVRQERLAADIARIVTDEQAALGTLGNRDAAALFLEAMLSARFPQWRGDALVGPVLRRTIASWEIRPSPGGFDEPARPTDLPRSARVRGEARAVPADPVRQSTSLDQGAGVLLLLRAVVDLRLPTVIRRADRDPDAVPSALLAAAGHLTEADPTPAMAVFAGMVDVMPGPERLTELMVPWPVERCGGLARQLWTVLRAQGLEAEEQGSDHGVGALVADVVLRAWRRWLGALGRSSTAYLLAQFVRRPGQVEIEPGRVLVTLAARPLDVVLEQAGYLIPLRDVGLLGGRDLVLRTEG
jgi:hypothetical protein